MPSRSGNGRLMQRSESVSTPPFDDPRLNAVDLFVETLDRLTAKLGAVHSRHGLSEKEFDILFRLARSPSTRLRMSNLAKQTAQSTTASPGPSTGSKAAD